MSVSGALLREASPGAENVSPKSPPILTGNLYSRHGLAVLLH